MTFQHKDPQGDQTQLSDFGVPGTAKPKEKIIIEVVAKWEKSDSEYSPSGYSGSSEIIHHPRGYPSINGGRYSPDFGNETVESIKKHYLDHYQSWYQDKEVIVKVKVEKDERQCLT
jgi:hypothetical protein